MVNPRFIHPSGINLGLSVMVNAEWTNLNLNAEYFLIPQIAIVTEIGTDSENGFFLAGAKYHINSNYSRSGFTPFIGLLAESFASIGSIKIPVGICYIAPFGLTVSANVDELFLLNTSFAGTSPELKLGWHF